MRKRFKQIMDRMQAIHELSVKESRDLTADEDREFQELGAESEALKVRIEREDKLARTRAWAGASQGTQTQPTGQQTDGDGGGARSQWRNIGEFVDAVRRNAPEVHERATTSASGGTSFLIPEVVNQNILMVDPLEVALLDAVTPLRATDNPDAPETFPVLDQSEDEFGEDGWYDEEEGVAPTESGATLKGVTLLPRGKVRLLRISQRTITNATQYPAFLEGLMRRSVSSLVDKYLIRGTGVKQPQGVRYAACKIAVTRNTSSQLKFADFVALKTALHPSSYGRARFLASTNTRPYIEGMVDDSKRPIFGSPDVAGKRPEMVCGIPIKFSQHCATLGSQDDLMLVDPGMILLKYGYGPAIAMSEHQYFAEGLVAVKIIVRLDAHVWANAAMTLANDHQVSYVVGLK